MSSGKVQKATGQGHWVNTYQRCKHWTLSLLHTCGWIAE